MSPAGPEGRVFAEASGREVVAHTDRLVLHQYRLEDAPFALRLLNEPTFLRFIGDKGVRTLEDARRYIEEEALESYRAHDFGPYVVERRTGGEPVGTCGLLRKPWLDAPDLGYALLPEAAGRGYATETGRAVLNWALDALRLPRVVAVVQPDNAASIRVLEKLGFAPDGTVTEPTRGEELARFALEAA